MTPLEVANIVEDMPDNELLTMLQDFEKDDYYFGDTDENVRGGSFDERAHTGARPKASKSKIVYPNELGEPGLREMSAHPRGTRDTMFDIDARPTTAAEGRKVIQPLLTQGELDIQRGIIADTPRRTYINDQLVQKGVIESGVDIFASDIDDATLKRAAPYLKAPDMQEGAALAFKTPNQLEFKSGNAKLKGLRQLAVIGPAIAIVSAAGQAMAGDFVGAGGTLLDEAAGEIGLDSSPVAGGGITDAPRQHQAIVDRAANPTVVDKIIQDPINELQYAGNQVMKFFGGALRMGSQAGF